MEKRQVSIQHACKGAKDSHDEADLLAWVNDEDRALHMAREDIFPIVQLKCGHSRWSEPCPFRQRW